MFGLTAVDMYYACTLQWLEEVLSKRGHVYHSLNGIFSGNGSISIIKKSVVFLAHFWFSSMSSITLLLSSSFLRVLSLQYE